MAATAASEVQRALAKVTRALGSGAEERPGQAAMAQAVAAAIATRRHLAVQAGTGTGKSLAYLVPAVTSGERVVVATATKALQDQLATKDLPAVARGLRRPVSFAVLKGRSNYLCLERAAEVSGGVQQELAADIPDAADAAGPGDRAGPEHGESGRLADQVRRLLAWAGTTGTGDRADLPFEPHPRAWAMLSVGPSECPGAHRCPEGPRCFAEKARARACESEVVVVNTHLYGAHLASGGAVLPEHEVVVFDEAHELEEVMTASLGVDLGPGRLAALHGAARPLLAPDDVPGADLGELADRLRAQLAERVGRRVLSGGATTGPQEAAPAGPGPRGREPAFFEPPRSGREPEAQDADADLRALLELVTARVERLRALVLATDAGGDVGGRRARVLAAAGHLGDDLARLAAPGPDDVAWVDGNARSPLLRLSPIDVGPALAATLWGSVTAVLTSATLPPRLEERVGMAPGEVDRVDVGSPFDYCTHSLLYVARHLPDRRRPEAEAAIVDELSALIEAAGGRTLALFTSYRAMEAAASALRPRLPYPLLVQGDLPKGRLLGTFAGDEASCLFATLGFWQGVDVPGRALSLVTLDRLPFGRPDHPLLEARRARAGDAAFALVDLPRAATLLAQGVGRLIRSGSDHGVVAVLDPRLATAGYRKVLLAGLPPMRRTVERADVEAFFARVLDGPDAGRPAARRPAGGSDA